MPAVKAMHKWIPAPGGRTAAVVLVASLVVGLAGYWGPWIAHRDVALILIGQDLGEFVKFLPEVRDGSLPMLRELFYLPPFCGCWALALLAACRTLRYPPLSRILFLVALLPVSLALLPPVFSVPVLRSAEFRVQVIGVVICLTLIPGWLLLRRLPLRVQSGLLTVCGLLGALPAWWQFRATLPAIARVYDAPLRIGWGIVALLAGFLTFALFSALLTVAGRPSRDGGSSYDAGMRGLCEDDAHRDRGR